MFNPSEEIPGYDQFYQDLINSPDKLKYIIELGSESLTRIITTTDQLEHVLMELPPDNRHQLIIMLGSKREREKMQEYYMTRQELLEKKISLSLEAIMGIYVQLKSYGLPENLLERIVLSLNEINRDYSHLKSYKSVPSNRDKIGAINQLTVNLQTKIYFLLNKIYESCEDLPCDDIQDKIYGIKQSTIFLWRKIHLSPDEIDGIYKNFEFYKFPRSNFLQEEIGDDLDKLITFFSELSQAGVSQLISILGRDFFQRIIRNIDNSKKVLMVLPIANWRELIIIRGSDKLREATRNFHELADSKIKNENKCKFMEDAYIEIVKLKHSNFLQEEIGNFAQLMSFLTGLPAEGISEIIEILGPEHMQKIINDYGKFESFLYDLELPEAVQAKLIVILGPEHMQKIIKEVYQLKDLKKYISDNIWHMLISMLDNGFLRRINDNIFKLGFFLTDLLVCEANQIITILGNEHIQEITRSHISYVLDNFPQHSMGVVLQIIIVDNIELVNILKDLSEAHKERLIEVLDGDFLRKIIRDGYLSDVLRELHDAGKKKLIEKLGDEFLRKIIQNDVVQLVAVLKESGTNGQDIIRIVGREFFDQKTINENQWFNILSSLKMTKDEMYRLFENQPAQQLPAPSLQFFRSGNPEGPLSLHQTDTNPTHSFNGGS